MRQDENRGRMALQVSMWMAFAFFVAHPAADGREWVDASGKYNIDAELLAYNDSNVILERNDKAKSLVSVALKDLSENDQAYVQKLHEDDERTDKSESMQVWTSRHGMKVYGIVVDYVKRDVSIVRQRGKVYVDQKRFDNLSGVYKNLVRDLVVRNEAIELKNEAEFKNWVKKQGGKKKTYKVEGIMMELEDGDLYIVPFQFFDESSREILKAGWADWDKAKDDEEQRKQEKLRLQAEASANQQKQNERRRVAQLSLQLQEVNAGIIEMWEVGMYPRVGFAGWPRTVIVTARNSGFAAQRALEQYPNYRVGPIAKVTRRY